MVVSPDLALWLNAPETKFYKAFGAIEGYIFKRRSMLPLLVPQKLQASNKFMDYKVFQKII